MNNENLKKGEATRFQTGEEQARTARKGGIKSGEKRRENRLIREGILERMKESDWNSMIDNAIKRAIETDRGFEILRDSIGQKPSDKVDMNTSLTMTEEDRKLYEKAIRLL